MNYLIDTIVDNPILIIFIIYIYSSFIISFSNVIIYRLPIIINFEYARLIKEYIKHDDPDVEKAYNEGLGLGISKPSSRCNSCLGQIKLYRNIPVISYLLNRGKCYHCKEKYSPSHFLTELLLPIIPLIIYFMYGLSYNTLFLISLFFVSYIITVIDFNHKIIPNQLVIALGFIVLLFSTTESSMITTQNALINVAITFVALNIFYKIINIKYAFGYGDIKILIVLSGLFNLEVFIHMMLMASIIGIIEILVVKRLFYKDKSAELAFGPSIMIASIAMFIMEKEGYLNILN